MKQPFDSTKDRETNNGLRISRTTMPDSSIRTNVKQANSGSDSYFSLLNQDSREITMVLTIDGEIKFCNQAVKKALGYEPQRLMGNNVKRIIPVEQWVAFRAALRASETEANEPINIDCHLIDSTDQRSYFSLAVRDLRHHPLVEGYVVHAHDISRLKRQEEKLTLHKLANELIKEAVVIIEVEKMKIVFANHSFYRLTGFTKAEIMGGKLDLFKAPYSNLLFAEQTSVRQRERFRKAIRKQSKFIGRVYSKRKNGSIFYHRFGLSPVTNVEGELTHYIASMKVINRRKKKSAKTVE